MAYMRKCRDLEQKRLEVAAGDWPFLFGWLVHGPWIMDHGVWSFLDHLVDGGGET